MHCSDEQSTKLHQYDSLTWRKDKEAVIDGQVVFKALYSKAFID